MTVSPEQLTLKYKLELDCVIYTIPTGGVAS